MMKLMSNDKFDKLRLNDDEVDKEKSLRKKKNDIQAKTFIDTPCESNVYYHYS